MRGVYIHKLGEESTHWKGGKPNCLDCGIKIKRSSKRCPLCSYKARKGVSTGIIPWNKGLRVASYISMCLSCKKPKAKNYKKKCKSCSHLGLIGLRGDKSSAWRGGITPQSTLERGLFKKYISNCILERDGYKCQLCEATRDLQVDHIQSWSEFKELRFDPDNCRTLCRACHYKITYKRDMPKNSRWGQIQHLENV